MTLGELFPDFDFDNKDMLVHESNIPNERSGVIKGTCRTCKHRQRWHCGGSVIQYCGVWKDKRTFNRLHKIKVYMSCLRYEKEE